MKTALVLLAVLGGALLPRTALTQLPTSQVVLENTSIRVTLLTFAPGGATGRHQGIESASRRWPRRVSRRSGSSSIGS